MFDLSGTVALVTGGGRGVGAEVGSVLARAGGAVVVNDLVLERAEAVVNGIRAAGGSAIAVRADITDRRQVDAMVRQAESSFGAVTILVNNAGVLPGGLGFAPFLSTVSEDWDAHLRLIVLGSLHCTQAVLPGMLMAGVGRIVSIVSDAARVGEPNVVPYATAKAAVMGFSRSLAKEVGPAGVTSNCVAIGRIEGTGPAPESGERDRALRRYPVRRFGRPEDVAAAVLWLASDEASWVTGQTIGVDGGYATS